LVDSDSEIDGEYEDEGYDLDDPFIAPDDEAEGTTFFSFFLHPLFLH
jgi:hypothetical protein